MTGFMGCGKSSVGKELAALLPEWCLIDLDTYIEKKQGKGIPEIFNEYGEAAFRRMESEALKAIFSDTSRPRAIISLGGGTVRTEECRRLIRRYTECFYLRATTETLLDNLEGHSAGRPMLVSTAGPVSGSVPPARSKTVSEPVETHRHTPNTAASASPATVGIFTERETLRQRIESLMQTRSALYLATAHQIIDIDGQTFAEIAAQIAAQVRPDILP